jgi:hypothetical protein
MWKIWIDSIEAWGISVSYPYFHGDLMGISWGFD